jgi:hypothetical protein
MSADNVKQEFIEKYLSEGDEKFYRFLLFFATSQLASTDKLLKDAQPNLKYLEYHDYFIILYRREGEYNYLKLARLFRRAGHRIYRVMLKKGLTPVNSKFLNLV